MAPARLGMNGVDLPIAAKLIGETADVLRLASKDAYARHNRSAPQPHSRVRLGGAAGQGGDVEPAGEATTLSTPMFPLSQPGPIVGSDYIGHNIDMNNSSSIYELSFTDNHGRSVSLAGYAGRPVLVVNTASKCGMTPHYEGLQMLHEEYGGQGLVVLGFPCDQFAHQEPGDDAQIEEFCRLNYGVTFPLSTKVDVNGAHTHPVFAFLKERAGGVMGSRIKWNFTKFLVSSDGSTVKRFGPKTPPEKIRADIETLLATPTQS